MKIKITCIPRMMNPIMFKITHKKRKKKKLSFIEQLLLIKAIVIVINTNNWNKIKTDKV